MFHYVIQLKAIPVFCYMIPSQLVTIRVTAKKRQPPIIQGDSGGKVNILQGDSIGHCEKNSSYENVLNSEW